MLSEKNELVVFKVHKCGSMRNTSTCMSDDGGDDVSNM